MLIKLNHEFIEKLTDTEKEVINFINSNCSTISNMSISDVAEATFSSPATVSRTIKKCGISGFAELRYMITQQTSINHETDDVNEVFKKSLTEVSNTIENISADTILKIVKEVEEAEKIYIFAKGLSEHVAAEFTLKLQVLGYPVIANYDTNMIEEMSKNLRRRTLVFIFTMSGTTPELITAAENASSLGAHIVTCTCVAGTPLDKIAHHSLIGYAHKYQLKRVDLASRMPLFTMTRIIADYIWNKKIEKDIKLEAQKKKQQSRKFHI